MRADSGSGSRPAAAAYPLATTFVVLATASHFLLDTVAGAAITGLGLLAAGHGRTLARRAGRTPARQQDETNLAARSRPGQQAC